MPECVTPGRLLAFLKSRNPDLNPRFDSVASEYMRPGRVARRALGFRLLPDDPGDRLAQATSDGNRSGDVRATQNNFAGLGAIGGGEPGESFKDIPTGVRAHLEHLLLYSGEKLENPMAERTRKVQEWGVLTKWQSRFTRPITFADLAAQWAPGSGSYARMLDGISERFVEFCEKPDPRPEFAAAVRRELRLAEARSQQPSGAGACQARHRGGQGRRDRAALRLGVQQETAAQRPLTAQQPMRRSPR